MIITTTYDVTGYNVNEVVEVNIERIRGMYVGRFEDWPQFFVLASKRYILDQNIPRFIANFYNQGGEVVRVRHVGARLEQRN